MNDDWKQRQMDILDEILTRDEPRHTYDPITQLVEGQQGRLILLTKRGRVFFNGSGKWAEMNPYPEGCDPNDRTRK